MSLVINAILIAVFIVFMLSPFSIHGAFIPPDPFYRLLQHAKSLDHNVSVLNRLKKKTKVGSGLPLFSYRGIGVLKEDGGRRLVDAIVATKAKNSLDLEVKPLRDIYRDYPIERPIEEVLAVADRTDRTLVAVLDSGVDYNHPDLAYKIARPSQEVIESYGREKITEAQELWKSRKDIKKYIADLKSDTNGIDHPSFEETITFLEGRLKEAEEIVHKTTIGWDFIVDDHLPFDMMEVVTGARGKGHGTAVAGIVSSTLHGTDDIAVLPISTRFDLLDGENFEQMVDFAYNRGARVFNLSYGLECVDCYKNGKIVKELIGGGILSIYKTMEKYSDVLFVTVAGNRALNLDAGHSMFPSFSNLPNVIVVTSVDAGNMLMNSNYGLESVHIAAHGIGVKSLRSRGGHAYFEGSSYAAPQVSRVAAQIKHTNKGLSPSEIISIIKETATKVEGLESKVRFGGVLNEKAALEFVKSL